MGYGLLRDIRVLEVALLAPDTAGRNLGDMGAEVIKIEAPPEGDYIRRLGSVSVGGPDGISLAHLNWNRGKKSLGLNLRTPSGRRIFLDLVAKSDVVVDGLRAGALDRLDLGYDTLNSVNPRIVYCSLSGLGRNGPYSRLATHGTFYDAYVGLKPPVYASDGTPRMPSTGDSIGIEAGGLYATIAILAAIIRALRTGQGSLVEVAEADAAAAFVSTQVESAVNNATDRDAAGGGLSESVRYNYYRTGDGRCILFQALEAKFWENFCTGIGRSDLLDRFPGRQPADHAAGNEELRGELQRIFGTRTQDEWVDFFLAQNIPGGPVHEPGTLVQDRHFEERGLMYEVQHPRLGSLKLFGTPIKVDGESFAADAAPGFGESTDAVLHDVLGMDDTEVARLRAEGAIG